MISTPLHINRCPAAWHSPAYLPQRVLLAGGFPSDFRQGEPEAGLRHNRHLNRKPISALCTGRLPPREFGADLGVLFASDRIGAHRQETEQQDRRADRADQHPHRQ
jgi:hypothetical protein